MAAKTMDELLAKAGVKIKSFRRGEKIDAKFVEFFGNSALFDIGGKAEGLLSDIYFDEARDFVKNLKIGDVVRATVINPEGSDGRVLLSLRHAAAESVWGKLEELVKEEKIVSVSVLGANEKGLSVEFEGNSGFVPANHLGQKALADMDSLVGTHLKVKVVEIDKARKRILFSERAVSEAESMEAVKQATAAVTEGEVFEAKVKQLTTYGAFVEISVKVGKKETPVEGMVHVSEIAWEKVKEPASVLTVGQVVKVKILAARNGKVSCSIKQALADPWLTAGERFKKDDKVKGVVVRKSDFGVFVQLEPGIEGLIHMTKIAPGTKMEMGQEIN